MPPFAPTAKTDSGYAVKLARVAAIIADGGLVPRPLALRTGEQTPAAIVPPYRGFPADAMRSVSRTERRGAR
jgi:hypothetical protein